MLGSGGKGRQARKRARRTAKICLPGADLSRNMRRMQVPAATPPEAQAPGWSRKKEIVVKFEALTLLTAVLGLAQGWSATRCYKPDHEAGFHMGLLHGLMMPAALPGLLLGKNPPIYAPNNSGRPYKIGYLFGINTCGTIFYGVSFWRPKRQVQ
jgi:hypothetical protein